MMRACLVIYTHTGWSVALIQLWVDFSHPIIQLEYQSTWQYMNRNNHLPILYINRENVVAIIIEILLPFFAKIVGLFLSIYYELASRAQHRAAASLCHAPTVVFFKSSSPV